MRRLPGTYRVTISERQAVTLLSIGDLYLVADDGTVFKPLAEGDPFDLPIITGIDRQEFTSDRDFRISIISDLVGLLDDHARVGLLRREKLAEIHLESGRGVSFRKSRRNGINGLELTVLYKITLLGSFVPALTKSNTMS